MSDPSLEVAELEGSSYRTWPDRMGVAGGGKRETQAGRRPSLSGLLLQAKSPKNLEALDGLRRPTLASALSSLSISYSPKTRGLHDSEAKGRMVPTESQSAKVPIGDAETQSCNDLGSTPSDFDQNFLRSDDSTCDDWNPRCGSEHSDDVIKLGPSEKETKPDSNQPTEEKGVLSKEGQQLQDDENQGAVLAQHDENQGEVLEDDENQGEVLEQQRYVPTHRKAFSLPRTLEVKNVEKKNLFSCLDLFVIRRGRYTCVPHSQRKHCHTQILLCSLPKFTFYVIEILTILKTKLFAGGG